MIPRGMSAEDMRQDAIREQQDYAAMERGRLMMEAQDRGSEPIPMEGDWYLNEECKEEHNV